MREDVGRRREERTRMREGLEYREARQEDLGRNRRIWVRGK